MSYMAKNRKKASSSRRAPARATGNSRWWIVALAAALAIGVVAVVVATRKSDNTPPPASSGAAPAPNTNSASAPTPPAAPATPAPTTPGAPKMETMEVAKAVMVTVELDFGPKIPTIAEALREIERRYQPSDGQGRTFAILDAYGDPTPDGKKLHMSMHVSSEKPGTGSLVFKRTGEVLWNSRITPAATPPGPKELKVFIDNGKGSAQIIDGSNNPASILDAVVRDLRMPVRDYWPDGEEREVTIIYSACGCPVKVMARRVGNRTARVSDRPVIFPDDPAAVTVVSRLMGW